MTDIIEQPKQSVLDSVLADPKRLAEVDTDKLDRLYAIHRDEEDRLERRQFIQALHAAQSEMEPVRKAAENKQTHSMYALLEDIEAMIEPIAEKHGLTYTVDSEPCTARGEDWSTYILTLMHIGGHEKKFTMDAPMDHIGPKGNPVKTRLHGMGSSYTYCARMLVTRVFKVRLTKDNDGNKPPDQRITDAQAAEIQSLLEDVGADRTAFLQWMGVEAISDIAGSQFKRAIQGLERKRRA